jgi:hypothetical protein
LSNQPHTDARSWYEGKPEKIKSVGEMNATLQGAYFMLAARSVGFETKTPEGCEIPAFAKAIGHEDKWLLHNGCPPRKDAKKNQTK